MKQQGKLQQILLDQITIPSKLITDYQKFRINEQEVMLLIHIHRFLQANIDFPTPAELAEYLTINEDECSYLLRNLIQKGFIYIEQTENNGQISEKYSLDPLWEKLYIEPEHSAAKDEMNEGTIFVLFEQEFGRPLSPFEIESINAWLDVDHFKPTLIKAALRESVLMGKLNFTYIDRILRNWLKKGIHTVEQARESSRNFRKPQEKNQVKNTKKMNALYYNWLEGES